MIMGNLELLSALVALPSLHTGTVQCVPAVFHGLCLSPLLESMASKDSEGCRASRGNHAQSSQAGAWLRSLPHPGQLVLSQPLTCCHSPSQQVTDRMLRPLPESLLHTDLRITQPITRALMVTSMEPGVELPEPAFPIGEEEREMFGLVWHPQLGPIPGLGFSRHTLLRPVATPTQ